MITTLKQTVAIADVTDIAVTTAQLADDDSGDYVREIRVSAGEGQGAEVFVLRLTAPGRASIEITAPEQEF